MGQTEGTGVVIQSYTEETIVDPTEWPSGAFLLDILRENQQLESLKDANGQLSPPYWQAAARRALMEKYGYYRCSASSCQSPNNNSGMLDSTEIESILDCHDPTKQKPKRQCRSDESTRSVSRQP
jgi:hypothetical protein